MAAPNPFSTHATGIPADAYTQALIERYIAENNGEELPGIIDIHDPETLITYTNINMWTTHKKCHACQCYYPSHSIVDDGKRQLLFDRVRDIYAMIDLIPNGNEMLNLMDIGIKTRQIFLSYNSSWCFGNRYVKEEGIWHLKQCMYFASFEDYCHPCFYTILNDLNSVFEQISPPDIKEPDVE